MKTLFGLVLSGAAATASAQAPNPNPSATPMVAVRAASASAATVGSPDNFSGTARISTPFAALPPGKAGGATVSFEPGARTAWHTHPLGQTLVVTAGVGLVQQDGQAAQLMRPGDVVAIPANTRHWHGASADAGMTHVAIAEKENGISVVWQEKLSDADYLAAVRSAGPTASRTPQPAPAQALSDALSAKQRAIPLMAAYMAASDLPQLTTALHQGLDAGLSISEAKEILVQLYAYAGFPKSLNALTALMQVVQARQQRGLVDAPGREPSHAVATGSALLAAGKANQTTISGGPVQGAVFDFAPVINQFLQAHLFGDIFERDNLDWQSRELATVGALAAMPGAEAQLRSHMRASLRVGLSAAQLQQLIQALDEGGLPDAARRAQEALTQALAQTRSQAGAQAFTAAQKD